MDRNAFAQIVRRRHSSLMTYRRARDGFAPPVAQLSCALAMVTSPSRVRQRHCAHSRSSTRTGSFVFFPSNPGVRCRSLLLRRVRSSLPTTFPVAPSVELSTHERLWPPPYPRNFRCHSASKVRSRSSISSEEWTPPEANRLLRRRASGRAPYANGNESGVLQSYFLQAY